MKESKKSSIKKIGPLWVLKGEITLFPNKSYPLKGFELKELKGTDSFFKSIKTKSNNWWNKFPNCCDEHKKLISNSQFDKEKYSFVKDQIYLSVRYFIHTMNENIDKENWFETITKYYDYLNTNFGIPGWGSHIFDEAITIYIDWVTYSDYEISDEQKLKLLDYIQPSAAEIKRRKENNGNIEDLYEIFEAWLNSMPSIGEIATIKNRISGKLPMGMFISQVENNEFLGIAKMQLKSPNQLLVDLENYSKSLLLAIESSLKKSFLSNNETIISLIDEKLRLKQQEIFKKDGNQNPSRELVIEWLNMWIEYFREFSTIKTSNSLNEFIRDTNTFLHEQIKNYDLLDANIASLRKDITLALEEVDDKMKKQVQSITQKLIEDFENRNLSNEEIEELSEKIFKNLESKNSLSHSVQSMNNLTDSVKNSKVSIKHKLQLAIPLFLFTKYIGEIEIGSSEKVPKNLKELKNIIFKE